MDISFSAIDIVEDLLLKAISNRASDIHLESLLDKLRVRVRIDGELSDIESIDKKLSLLVISRVKVLSNMNVAEKRIPQDGKFSYTYNNRDIDIRVSSFPGIYGEKLVVRLLDRFSHAFNLENLGFDAEIISKLNLLASRSNGFFLVVGPTGSGKTTTLYSLLSLVNTSQRNIVTLEDPVEYIINGVTQGNVNTEIGFTFAKGIRSILRQDPDVIMVGEIRDIETAKTALQAALTGHLVFSTLHTGSASSTLMRLLDMQIEPYLLTASLTGVLAQRLIKKLCTYCRTKINLKDHELKLLKKYNLCLSSAYHSLGCQECEFLGYKNRLLLSELLLVTHELRALFVKSPVYQDIYNQACADGMSPIVKDALNKANMGLISYKDLILLLED